MHGKTRERNYAVEGIEEEAIKDGVRLFKISWKGKKITHTWEPIHYLTQCN
jgi:hypothetical protein